MSVLRLAFTAMALVAASASAEERAPADLDPIATAPGAKVVVVCASTSAPKLADVGEVVGTRYDMWASFVARQRLIALAKPACARGVDVVHFVPMAAARDGRLALADIDAP